MAEDDETGDEQENVSDVETEAEEDAPPDRPNDRAPPLKLNRKKKKKGQDNKDGGLTVIMPPCRHEWCFGEVLRKGGIEPGVCCPKPLPWGVPGRLRYIPGWEKACLEYSCRPVRYGIQSAKRNKDPDIERKKFEEEEARILWSYIGPVLTFPKTLKYDEKEPTKVCSCMYQTCKMGEIPPPQPPEPNSQPPDTSAQTATPNTLPVPPASPSKPV